MKSIIFFLGVFALSLPVFAEVSSSKQKAIEAFIQYQDAGEDEKLLALEKQIEDADYVIRNYTDATVLNSGCGFAGCSYVYLVTTSYTTPGSNKRSTSIVAIVKASTYEKDGTLVKILSRSEYNQLLGNE